MQASRWLLVLALFALCASSCTAHRHERIDIGTPDRALFDALFNPSQSVRENVAPPRNAQWSPDGRLLAFTWAAPEDDRPLLWLYNPAAKTKAPLLTYEQLLANAPRRGGANGNMSAKAVRIVDFCWRNNQELLLELNGRLVAVDMQSKSVRTILTENDEFFGYSCSADGKYLAFLRDDDQGLPQAWALDLGGGQLRQLTNRQGANYRVDYSHTEWFTARGKAPVFWSPAKQRLFVVQHMEMEDKRNRINVAHYEKPHLEVEAHTRHLQGDQPFVRYRLAVYDLDNNSEWVCYEQTEPVMSYIYPAAQPWSFDGNSVAFQVMEHEKHIDTFYHADVAAKTCANVHRDDVLNLSYSQQVWSASGQLYFTSEQTGWLNVYKPAADGKAAPTTPAAFDFALTDLLSHPVKNMLYAVSWSDETLPNNDIFSLSLDTGGLRRWNMFEEGWSRALALAPDGAYLSCVHGSARDCDDLYVIDEATGMATRVTDSRTNMFGRVPGVTGQFISFKSVFDSCDIRATLYLPPNMRSDKRYPLFVMVYGGPTGAPSVRNTPAVHRDMFMEYLCLAHQFICLEIDPHGTTGYGKEFRQCMRDQAGQPQTRDLEAAVKHMVDNYHADAARTVLFGWSFGGFQTLATLCMSPNTFKAGIAGAPVVVWQNYPYDYNYIAIGDGSKQSLVPLAEKMQAELLLVAGMQDTNVIFEDSMAFYRALLKAGKADQVEFFIDPTGNHGLGGDVDFYQLYRKMDEFLERVIGLKDNQTFASR